jgi:hypothetical protein
MVPSSISRLYTPEVLGRLASIKRPASPREDAAADSVRQRHIIFSGEELPGHALRVRRAAWWSLETITRNRGEPIAATAIG